MSKLRTVTDEQAARAQELSERVELLDYAFARVAKIDATTRYRDAYAIVAAAALECERIAAQLRRVFSV